MTTERVPLTPTITNRNATTSKDAIGFNCLYESHSGGKDVVKRPGLYTLPVSPSLPTGEGQGLFSWNNYLIVGQSNSVYGISGSVSSNLGTISGTSQPLSFTQTANDNYLALHNGANLYCLTKAAPTLVPSLASAIVANATVNVQGMGYIVTPSVTFSPSPTGVTATGTATVQNKQVTGITIINPGTAYVTPPSVTIAAPTDVSVTATGTVSHNDYPLGGVNYRGGFAVAITNGGTNYVTPPGFSLYSDYWNDSYSPVGWKIGTVGGSDGYTVITNGIVTSAVINQYLYGVPYSTTSPTITVRFDAPPAATLVTALASASMVNAISGPYAFGLPYLNSRVFIMTVTGTIYQSGIDNPTSWNPAEYSSANSDPDNGVALIRHLNYLVAFGQWSTDFFYDAGNPIASVLAQYQAAKLEIGCAAGPTVAAAEQTVFWVGQGLTEGRGVYMLEGTSPIKLSTRYIDRLLNQDTLVGTHSYCLKVAGHTLYILTLLASNLTLVYDVEEKEWYRWTSQTGGVESYFKPTYYCGNVEYTPNLYLQNETNGQVYTVSPDYYSDGADTIYFRIRTPQMDGGSTKRKFYRRVELVGDKSNGVATISHSDDDYQTWSTPRSVSLLDTRPILYQNGSARRRAWEIFSSALIPIRLNSMEIDVDVSE